MKNTSEIIKQRQVIDKIIEEVAIFTIRTEDGKSLTPLDGIQIKSPTTQEITNFLRDQLRQQPDDLYGDAFNRSACETLDLKLKNRLTSKQKSLTPENIQLESSLLRQDLIENTRYSSNLSWANAQVISNLPQTLTSGELEIYQNQQRLRNLSTTVQEALPIAEKTAGTQLENISKKQLIPYLALWSLTTTNQPYPFKNRVYKTGFLNQLADSFFKEQALNIPTFTCMSYVHEQQSEPETVRVDIRPIKRVTGRDNDDLDALENYARTIAIYRKFIGYKTQARAIVSDIDFMEVFKVTDSQAILEADEYYAKFEVVARQMDIPASRFTDILKTNNQFRTAFGTAITDIRDNISRASRSSWLNDPQFYLNYSYIEKMARSIFDYYNGLPGVSMQWEVALQNTLDKVAVYGSQPAALRTLYPTGYTFFSSEFPVRDDLYTIRDKKLRIPLAPIVYPLKLNYE